MNFLKKSLLITFWCVLSVIILLSSPRISLAISNNLNPKIQLGSTGSYVYLLQKDLNGLGSNFNNFKINGIFGVTTQRAVGHYQDEYKLPRDGTVGYNTWKVLSENIKAVQRGLNSLGYNTGYPDGRFGQMTTNALKRFQKDNRLDPEGVVNPRTRQRLFNPNPKNDLEYRSTSNSIRSLNPYVAGLARKFLDLAKANNLDVRILTAFRSWDEQDRLYAQGRTTPGDIITNTRGGGSYHNWGLAFDAAPFENGVQSNDMSKYKKMGKLAVQVGLEWGGNFKDIVDLPHFQYTFGLNAEDLLNGVRPRM
jgi:peptidoglycan LD-endopeptidase CwlK